MTARAAAAALALAACAHGRLQTVPLLVSPDVLVDEPAATARAQILRDALLSALRDEHYCLDRRGDFEAMLQLRADVRGGDLLLVLTLDKGAGVRIEEVERRYPATPLPPTRERADSLVRPLLHELADSGEARALAADVQPCVR